MMKTISTDQVIAHKGLSMNRDDYWRVLQENVCTRCADGDKDGNCHLDKNRECPLKVHLPFVITSVNRISSIRIQDYAQQLHTIICDDCKYQTDKGTCVKRVKEECALDHYFPLMIDSIEQIAEKTVE